MIEEYEIPRGSKLYFGESARRKRAIENRAAEIFIQNGFEEIITPLFSYHQTASKDLITFSDADNYSAALRRDSALEVSRLILKRLGRATEHRKWFYIQPICRYPTTEINQIGAEAIGANDTVMLIGLCAKILEEAGVKAILQIGSISLLKKLQELLKIDEQTLIRHEIHKLLDRREGWVRPLVELSGVEQLDGLSDIVPDEIKGELKRLKETALACAGFETVLSPFYYADMAYYDEIYFRFLLNKKQVAMGGGYESGEGRAAGFAIYTDTLLSVGQ
ncbi:MAG: ATP phosphoribosyltransferase regulatory subunit [Helicobacteraceae bacterium]|jgi:histidyl-tRNA synthetase|nr:ATP phosphoribosyltransferase regulatory subunit [Helicobacteraceae bacterium]